MQEWRIDRGSSIRRDVLRRANRIRREEAGVCQSHLGTLA